MKYVTFLRSARNFKELASNPKIIQEIGLSYHDARANCQEYNSNLSERDIENGTKMEFTEEDCFTHRELMEFEESN
jgi:hypothetical protein